MEKEIFIRRFYELIAAHKEDDLRDIEKLLVEYENNEKPAIPVEIYKRESSENNEQT